MEFWSKKHTKTLQTPPTAQLALREADQHKLVSFGSIAGNVMRVKAFLLFLQGVPASYTWGISWMARGEDTGVYLSCT